MPKMTYKTLKNKIIAESYHQFAGTNVTICCLTLDNGYNAIGQSTFVDSADFDIAIGQAFARADAAKDLENLYRFNEKEKLFQAVSSFV